MQQRMLFPMPGPYQQPLGNAAPKLKRTIVDHSPPELADLEKRLAKFGLSLHVERTRLSELGKMPSLRRIAEGERRCETFADLGFTRSCALHSRGTVRRQRMVYASCIEAFRHAVPMSQESLGRRLKPIRILEFGLLGLGDDGPSRSGPASQPMSRGGGHTGYRPILRMLCQLA